MKTALLISLLFVLATAADAGAAEKAAAEATAGLLDKYRESIRSVELSSGAYDRQLIEPLRSAARLLSERGDYEEAVRAYSRLLHLNRINNGFYHPGHLDIVGKIIENNAARQDWPGLNNNHDYLYWLCQRVHENDPAKLAPRIRQVLQWKVAYLSLNPQSDKSSSLVELEHLSEHLLTTLIDGEADYRLLASALYQRALIHYFYAVALDQDRASITALRLLNREAPHLKYQDEQTTLGPLHLLLEEDPFFPGAPAGRMPHNRIKPIIDRHMVEGRRLLERILESAKGQPVEGSRKESEALARVYLADWNLLMGRRGSALAGYQEAYKLMLDAGVDPDRVNAFFSRPAVLPRAGFLPALPASGEVASTGTEIALDDYLAWTRALPAVNFPREPVPDYVRLDEREYLELEFDVGLNGKVFETPDSHSMMRSKPRGNTRQIQILDEKSKGDRSRRTALDEVEQLTFRPRLVNGEPVVAEGVRMRYFYSSEQ